MGGSRQSGSTEQARVHKLRKIPLADPSARQNDQRRVSVHLEESTKRLSEDLNRCFTKSGWDSLQSQYTDANPGKLWLTRTRDGTSYFESPVSKETKSDLEVAKAILQGKGLDEDLPLKLEGKAVVGELSERKKVLVGNRPVLSENRYSVCFTRQSDRMIMDAFMSEAYLIDPTEDISPFIALEQASDFLRKLNVSSKIHVEKHEEQIVFLASGSGQQIAEAQAHEWKATFDKEVFPALQKLGDFRSQLKKRGYHWLVKAKLVTDGQIEVLNRVTHQMLHRSSFRQRSDIRQCLNHIIHPHLEQYSHDTFEEVKKELSQSEYSEQVKVRESASALGCLVISPKDETHVGFRFNRAEEWRRLAALLIDPDKCHEID